MTTELTSNDAVGEQSTSGAPCDLPVDHVIENQTTIDDEKQPIKDKGRGGGRGGRGRGGGGSLVNRWKNITEEYEKKFVKKNTLNNKTADKKQEQDLHSGKVSRQGHKVGESLKVKQRINLDHFDKVSRLIGSMALAQSIRSSLVPSSRDQSTTESHSMSESHSTIESRSTTESHSVLYRSSTDQHNNRDTTRLDHTTGNMNMASPPSMSIDEPGQCHDALEHTEVSESREHPNVRCELDRKSMECPPLTEYEQFRNNDRPEIEGRITVTEDKHLNSNGFSRQRVVDAMTSHYQSFSGEWSDVSCSSSSVDSYYSISPTYSDDDDRQSQPLATVVPSSDHNCKPNHRESPSGVRPVHRAGLLLSTVHLEGHSRQFSDIDITSSNVDFQLFTDDEMRTSRDSMEYVNEQIIKRDNKMKLMTSFMSDSDTGSTISVACNANQTSPGAGISDTGIANQLSQSNWKLSCPSKRNMPTTEAPPVVVMRKQQTLNLILCRASKPSNSDRSTDGCQHLDKQFILPTTDTARFSEVSSPTIDYLSYDETTYDSDDDVTVHMATADTNNEYMTSPETLTLDYFSTKSSTPYESSDGRIGDVIMTSRVDVQWRENSKDEIKEDEQEQLEITTVEEKVEKITFQIREDLEFKIFKSHNTGDAQRITTTDIDSHVTLGVRPAVRYQAVVDRKKHKSTKIEKTTSIDETITESRDMEAESRDVEAEVDETLTADEREELVLDDDVESVGDVISSQCSSEYVSSNSIEVSRTRHPRLVESLLEPSNFYFIRRTVDSHQ